MKTIFKLAIRYLIKCKARTFSSFIGIFLSSFLITTVLLASFSIYHSNKLSNSKMYGNWHIAFMGEMSKEKEEFVNTFKKECIGKKSLLGYSTLNVENSNIHICVFGADENWYNIMNVDLVIGHMPQKKGEVLVSRQFYERFCNEGIISDEGEIQLFSRYDSDGELLSELVGYSQSDILEYKESIRYKVVGVYNDTNRNMLDTWYYSFYTISEFDSEQSYLYVQMNNPENVFEIGESISEDYCIYNLELLDSLGVTNGGENSRSYIISIACIALMIVVFSTLFLIANSFMTTFDERVKQTGILLSLGMKKRQIFILTLFECAILALMAIPVGMITSIFFTYLIVDFYGNYLSEIAYATIGFEVYISPWILIIILLVSFLVMFLASLYPAFTSRNVDVINIIRQNSINGYRDMNPSKKEQSVETIIVKRNLKKYKKKYLVARISLVISIVLLLVFKILCHYTTTLIDIDKLEFDIKINSNTTSMEENIDLYNKYVLEDKRISKSWWIMETNEEPLSMDELALTNEAKEYLKQLEDVNVFYKYLVIDDTTFENILTDKSQIYYYDPLYIGKIDDGEYIEDEYKWLEDKSGLYLDLFHNNTCSIMPLPEESKGFFCNCVGNISIINIILSESIASRLLNDVEVMYSCYVVADDHNSVAENLEKNTDVSVLDIAEDYETQKNSIITIDLISKGFAFFIWLFSCVNTLFTIITNISTRKKEFAILMSLGMNKRNLIKIFIKECVYNLSLVCFCAYGLCIIISEAFWILWNLENYYFPMETAIIFFVVNLFLYAISYLISYMKTMYISIVDELKIE